jgi:hypothetical protein
MRETMMPDEINGLPTHVLLVHAVVVLVPLAALLVTAAALWPAFRRRLGIAVPVVAFVALLCVPLTTQAGGWLASRLPPSPLLFRHTELGDTLLPWAVGLFLVSAAIWAVSWFTARSAAPAGERQQAAGRSGRMWVAARIVLAVLAIVVSVGSVVRVYQIGDSGAKAAWTGRLSQQAAPPHGHDD